MSKKELLTKRLLLAVTCAVSIQMLSMQTVWAAESSTGGTDSRQTTTDSITNPAEDSEESEQSQETDTAVSRPQTNYLSRSTMSNDYGIMPRGAQPPMSEDTWLQSLAIGTNASFGANGYDTAVGNDAQATRGSSSAFGAIAEATGEYSSAFGRSAAATAINSSAFGAFARATGENSGAFGIDAQATGDRSSAFGSNAAATGENSGAFGYYANAAHKNSVAIGANSVTTNINQVSFGSASSKRALIGISDITMDGAINGVNISDLSTTVSTISNNTAGISVESGTTKLANGFLVGSGSSSSTYGMTASGELTAGSSSIGGVAIANGEVDGVNISALYNAVSGTGGLSEDIGGISRAEIGSTGTYTTTIETNTAITTAGISTNAITATGTITASEFVENGKKLSATYAAQATTLAGYNIDDAYTKDEVDTELGKKANTATSLGGYGITDAYTSAQVDTALLAKANADATDLSEDNKTAWRSALGVVDASVDLAALQSATTGMSYDNSNNTTNFTGNLTVGTGFSVSNTGALTVTSASIGGLAIANGRVDTVDVAALYTQVQSISTSGTATADTKGVKRSAADSSNPDYYQTTIEGQVSIDTAGVVTGVSKINGIELSTNSIGDITFENGVVKNIGAVNFGAQGALTGISSINGMAFGNGTIGGVSLSGGKVNGVDVGGLQNRVAQLEAGGGGGGTGGSGGANTSGITRPDPDKNETVIEGSTTIDQEGVTTGKVTVNDQVVIGNGKENQVTINEDGIHVGKNSSVMNDTEGFITDKGLYVGVNSSSDISTAKFSVAKNGDAVFKSDTHNSAFNGGSNLDTKIQGNTISTGSISTDKIIYQGTEVTVANGVIGQTQAVNNQLTTSHEGKDYTNDFSTSAMNGTTQSSTLKDGDTTTSFTANTKYDGMSLSSNQTTVRKDADGNVTETTINTGKTTMGGDSISLSKTEIVQDKDGKETSKTTSSTNIESGEIYLNRDGSSIAVGSSISGLQSDVRDLDNRVSRMGTEIKEVGALSAALAGLHPMGEDANARTSMAMAIGSYEGKQAVAVGGFYRPNKRTMLSVGGSFTTSKQMFNMGVSFALDRMPERQYQGNQSGIDSNTLQTLLARLDANDKKIADNDKQIKALEANNEKLAADYNELKARYEKELAAKNTN